MTELENAIKDMKEKKATDESGLIAEYLKALKDKEELRILLNDVIDGGAIPLQWKESRVVLVHKGGDMSELKNYRPIAIINVICKLCMIIVRDRVNRWVEESGMLGDVQGGFRKGRRTEDNLFIVERLIEMTRRRKVCLFVAFIDMEKAYDRVDRKKLFEVLRAYGIHEKMVSLIERVYSGNMVKFELGNVVTKWCKSESGVRQGCPLSPLLFNLYIRELGMRIEECQEGFKYTSVNSNGGELKRSNLAGLMYADDVCLFAESAESLQRVCDHVSTVIEEYGLKVSEKKSKVVCINGIRGIRRKGKLVAQILMKLKNISI